MISFSSQGSFKNTEIYLNHLKRLNVSEIFRKVGEEGVRALAASTPKDSGLTAASWDYFITKTREGVSIIWTNSNTDSGFPVAIMLQYGHGTGVGGYVEGRDYINPAIKPIFDRISSDVREAVRSR